MTATAKIAREFPHKKEIQRITQVDQACIQDNHALALSVNSQDIDRYTRLMRQYGILTPPVVGNLADGSQVLLYGECEFLASREAGQKTMEAVLVPIADRQEGHCISLMLTALKKSPNAVSEGLLLTELFETGRYTQTQLGQRFGKSVSWVNKRISLITRLDPAVKDLVTLGQICPQSAQEISRLPTEVQHRFSVALVKEGLPKSSVETLVAAFNARSSTSWTQEQIVSKPREALARLVEDHSVRAIRKKDRREKAPIANDCSQKLRELQWYLADILKDIYQITAPITAEIQLLDKVRSAAMAVIKVIDQKTSLSPGKKGAEKHGN